MFRIFKVQLNVIFYMIYLNIIGEIEAPKVVFIAFARVSRYEKNRKRLIKDIVLYSSLYHRKKRTFPNQPTENYSAS